MTKVTIQDVAAAIVDETYTVLPDGRTTICQLTMRNGFTVDGKSACVDKNEFNAELGNKYARAQAVEKVWMFLGYDLQNKLAASKPTTYMERLNTEAMELCVKVDKLSEFMKTPAYKGIAIDERRLLNSQLSHMQSYYLVLVRRLGLAA